MSSMEIANIMETPGMMLKREREARGLTIKYIAAETKISETSLLAIENNEFSAFPAEVFVRGFLRNYARVLAIPGEEVIRAYEALRDQSVQRTEVPTEDVREAARELAAANTDEEMPARPHHFHYAYIVVVLIAIASISLSVAFTGIGEAGENGGYYEEADQSSAETPFLRSTTSEGEGWIIK